MPPNWVRWMKAGQATAIVDAQGRGDFPTVQAGVDAVEVVGSGRIWVRNGTYDEGVTISGTQIHLSGEGWGAKIINNSGKALICNGTRNFVDNIQITTTSGGGGGGNAIDVVSGTGYHTFRDIYIPDSDQEGYDINAPECQIFGGRLDAADNTGVRLDQVRCMVMGMYSRADLDAENLADNFNFCGNSIHTNATALRMAGGCIDGIYDGNLMDGSISDLGSGNTAGSNEQY